MFISKSDSEIFLSWSNIDAIAIIQLGAAIMICFFMPGYAVVLIITKTCKINPIARVLFAYLISMLISGAIGYALVYIWTIPYLKASIWLSVSTLRYSLLSLFVIPFIELT